MQRNPFLFLSVILALFLSGPVLANTRTELVWDKSRLETVLHNGATASASQPNPQLADPTDSTAQDATPELPVPVAAPTDTQVVDSEAEEPSDPDGPITEIEAQNLRVYLPIVATDNNDNSELQAAAAPVAPAPVAVAPVAAPEVKASPAPASAPAPADPPVSP